MKKLFVMAVTILLSAGCAAKYEDPYEKLRQKTSAELFNGGEEALAKGRYTEAVKQFEALAAVYPFGPHAEQAQLDIIYAYYKDNDVASGIAAADRYIRFYPRARHTDYAYYMRGIMDFQLGLSKLQKLVHVNPASHSVGTLEHSFSSFSTLVQNFPKSIYVPDALARMRYIRNLMAEREILVAKFYMKRHAYVAAVNRANYVIQHFQGSPQVIQGLIIMVQAYRKLELPKMANEIYQLLQKNYPGTSIIGL